MIKCGVFDSICGDAKTALQQYLKARKEYKNYDDSCNPECEHCLGHLSKFDCLADLQEAIFERGKHEHELLGTMVSVDPLADYLDLIEEEHNFPGEKKMFQGEKAMIGGIISQVKELVTKKGKNPGAEMCQVWIELPIDSVEDELSMDDESEDTLSEDAVQIVAFPDTYKRVKADIQVGTPVLVEVEKLRDGLGLKSIFRLDKLKATC
jgi:DNA polymerase III alpha subunit